MQQTAIRRWGPWLALVIVFALATSALSWWQFDRRNQRVDRINQVLENYDRSPVDYFDLTWEVKADGTSDMEWTPALVSGQYLPQHSVLVRNRPLSGQAGFLQLVPLQLSDGRILIIERGWIAASSELITPESNPLPDATYHELTVRLRVGEPNLGRDPAETLASIDLAAIKESLAGVGPVITDHYGRIASEEPTYEATPIAMPKPSLNEGNHLSYAIQWIIFGLMAFVAFFWALRNDRRMRLEEAGLAPPRQKKKTRADIDADFEDANQ